jgi:hypothetical protein
MASSAEMKDNDSEELVVNPAGVSSANLPASSSSDTSVPRPVMKVTVPPLLGHVQHRLNYFRERGSLFAAQIASSAGRILAQCIHAPLLSRNTLSLSPTWQRVLGFVWLQRHQNRRLFRKVGESETDAGWMPNHGVKPLTNEPNPGEAIEGTAIADAEDSEPVTAENQILPIRGEGSSGSSNRLSQLSNTYGHLPVMEATDDTGSVVMNRSSPPNVSRDKPYATYPAIKSQDPVSLYTGDAEGTPARLERQSERSYRRRWQEHAWSPPILQRLLNELSSTRMLSAIRKDSSSSHPMLREPRSSLTDESTGEAGSWTAPQFKLADMPTGPELVTPAQKVMEAANYHERSVSLESEENLPHTIRWQREPIGTRAEASTESQDILLTTGDSLDVAEGKSTIPVSRSFKAAGRVLRRLPISRGTVRPAPEISQVRRALSLVDLVTQRSPIAQGKAGVSLANMPSELDRVVRGPLSVSEVTSENFEPEIGEGEQAEVLYRREPKYLTGLRPQLSPIAEDAQSPSRTMNLQRRQGFEALESVWRLEQSKECDSPLNRGHESFPYEDNRRDTRQSELDSVLTSSPTSLISRNVIQRREATPASFGSQPLSLELAAAPVQRASETPKPGVRPSESESKGSTEEAPDIDEIARKVYRILKRQLTTERERALGLS